MKVFIYALRHILSFTLAVMAFSPVYFIADKMIRTETVLIDTFVVTVVTIIAIFGLYRIFDKVAHYLEDNWHARRQARRLRREKNKYISWSRFLLLGIAKNYQLPEKNSSKFLQFFTKVMHPDMMDLKSLIALYHRINYAAAHDTKDKVRNALFQALAHKLPNSFRVRIRSVVDTFFAYSTKQKGLTEAGKVAKTKFRAKEKARLTAAGKWVEAVSKDNQAKADIVIKTLLDNTLADKGMAKTLREEAVDALFCLYDSFLPMKKKNLLEDLKIAYAIKNHRGTLSDFKINLTAILYYYFGLLVNPYRNLKFEGEDDDAFKDRLERLYMTYRVNGGENVPEES